MKLCTSTQSLHPRGARSLCRLSYMAQHAAYVAPLTTGWYEISSARALAMAWITVGLMKAQPVFLIRKGSKDTIGHFTAVAAIFGLASLSKAATRVSKASAEGPPSPLNLRTAA